MSAAGRKLANNICSSCDLIRKRKQKCGITLKEYEELLEQQNGRCAICGTNMPGGKIEHFVWTIIIKLRIKKILLGVYFALTAM